MLAAMIDKDPLSRSYLANAWYQAGWSEEVTSAQPLVRTLLDQPILLWRDDVGELHAVLDMCPHRFAPLSEGKIKGGKVVCGYHGLEFGTDGKCVHNPHGPVTKTMCVRSYPVFEKHFAVWIWMGEPERASETPIPDLSFIDRTPESARIFGIMPTQANFRLLTDNIMDLSHADYLHPTTLGGIMSNSKAKSWEEDGKVTVEWTSVATDPIPAAAAMLPEDAKADTWTQVEWQAPALMILRTATVATGAQRGPDDEAWTLHNMVPETIDRSHYFFCSVRGFLTDDEGFSAYLKSALKQAFEDEDKPMIEAQQRRIGSRDFWDLNPILLKSDAAAIRVRRKLDAMIAAEKNSKIA